MTNIAAQTRTNKQKQNKIDLELEERGRDHQIKEEQIVILLSDSKLFYLSYVFFFFFPHWFFYKGIEKGLDVWVPHKFSSEISGFFSHLLFCLDQQIIRHYSFNPKILMLNEWNE